MGRYRGGIAGGASMGDTGISHMVWSQCIGLRRFHCIWVMSCFKDSEPKPSGVWLSGGTHYILLVKVFNRIPADTASIWPSCCFLRHILRRWHPQYRDFVEIGATLEGIAFETQGQLHLMDNIIPVTPCGFNITKATIPGPVFPC